jgi:hypothetical protein
MLDGLGENDCAPFSETMLMMMASAGGGFPVGPAGLPAFPP